MDDLISRKALSEDLQAYRDQLYEEEKTEYDTGFRRGIAYAREFVKTAPAIEVPRWIPVTERLPTDDDANEYGYVLGFDKNENYAIWHKSHFENHPEWFTHWTNLLDAPKDGE